MAEKQAASGRWTIISEDRAVGDTNPHPDLVLKKNNEISILDIICPFKNKLEAFDNARKEKENEYAKESNKVRVEVIIVGYLGSRDPKNDCVIR